MTKSNAPAFAALAGISFQDTGRTSVNGAISTNGFIGKKYTVGRVKGTYERAPAVLRMVDTSSAPTSATPGTLPVTKSHGITRGGDPTSARFSQYVIHNGVCYLAGQVARGTSDGSVRAQTQAILAKIDGLLEQAGTDKGRLLSCTVYLSDASTAAEMNSAWDEWLSRDAMPTRATVESRLVADDIHVEIVATAAMPQVKPQVLDTPLAAQAVGPYVQGIRMENGTVYVSGCIGLLPGDGDPTFAGDNVEDQAKQCLKNMDAIVKSANAQIVKTMILLDDIADFAKVNVIYKDYFGDGPVPARSCFAAKQLPKGALVEIEAIAQVIED